MKVTLSRKHSYNKLATESPPSHHHHFKRNLVRSSFKFKRDTQQETKPLVMQSLPLFVPPKAVALLQIESKHLNQLNQAPKTATIRKSSVWAKINIPSNERFIKPQSNMDFIQRIKGESSEPMQIGQSQIDPKPTSKSLANDESHILKDFANQNGHNRLQPQIILPKHTKKQSKIVQAQMNKIAQVNVHFHALFAAVEGRNSDKVRTILESTDVDVNSVNSDGLTPLDVAVLSNNRSMTKILLQHGALSGPQTDHLGNYLNSLMFDAEQKVTDLGGLEENPVQNYNARASFSSIIGSTGQTVSGCTGTENEKQIGLWERRIKGLKRMLMGWEQSRPPDPPFAFSIDVTGINSVLIKILEPTDEIAICTKFKVQWSSKKDFSNLVGERIITEWSTFQGTMGANCYINELTQGRRYFFRACSGNIKGWGAFTPSNPTSLIPSTWRDIDRKEKRFQGRQRLLDELFGAVSNARPSDASEILLDNSIQRRNPKKKTTIKQLFSAASKFQKNLKRGIYLACILYFDDKILVTNEDFIPVIEIDETYPSNFNNDYYWLMKIACTWDDVKLLKADMEKNPTSAVHFRSKLLTAAYQMQSALCITDLGQIYHKPLKDSQGTVVFCCVNNIKNPKNISVLNSRWVPLNKVQKKLPLHDNTMNEILLSSIQDQIVYNQTSSNKLSKGLYLGYLKMHSSFDTIQVVVPCKTPNVLPFCKIRDNPHISAEEWEIMKSEKATANIPLHFDETKPTEVQLNFLESLTLSSKRLFNYMNVTSEDALQHRLFDVEVIELNHDVSFLIICPPADSSCVMPGQNDFLTKRTDLFSLPLQTFEMIHLQTYQHNIIQKYSRLSCIIELDTILANHSHREAFSSAEVQTTRERLIKLQELSANLNGIWKTARWLMDVICFTRDKEKIPELDMRKILEFKNVKRAGSIDNTQLSSQLLQLPSKDFKAVKTSPSRGSWPGPAAQNSLVPNNASMLCPEYSKSEQHLSLGISSAISSRHLSVSSCVDTSSSRKNSADSNFSSYYSSGEQAEDLSNRLIPSKSEDTLVVIRKKGPHNSHRKRSTSTTTTNKVDRVHGAGTSLVVHRVNTIPSEPPQMSSDSDSATMTPSKNKLRVSHHPSTFLKPTLTALQNEGGRSFQESLLIVEDEAIEMLSSPFRSAPDKQNTNLHQQKQLFGNQEKFIRSGIPHKTSQGTAADTIDRGAVNFSQQAKKSAQTTPTKSHPKAEEKIGSEEQEERSGSSESSILQVFAAYETGLAIGTSLKISCTTNTTAREVVDLVVKQLNMAVVLKGKESPIYTADQLENFCLVALIGARERILRDDFRPLQLQNPWSRGKLYVRQKHDLLAAIESNTETSII